MKPSEAVPFNLRYKGPDVDDGSMSIEDIVPVLEGIASAYGRIEAETNTGVHQRTSYWRYGMSLVKRPTTCKVSTYLGVRLSE